MPPLTPEEIVAAHGAFGQVEAIIARRRAIYSAAIELGADADIASSLSVEVLDDPAVRAHVGGFLAGITPLERGRLRRIESVHAGTAKPPRVACSRPAARMLEPALARIRGELARRGDDGAGALLTVDDRNFGPALSLVAEGIDLARAVSPRLMSDLLPHVGLLAMVTRDEAALLGSASDREYPGLILLPTPRSAIEVAEALVHEGAHQKLFDLAMTHTIFGPAAAARFRPPWAPTTAPAWPLAQCVAAFHAYTLLATFEGDVRSAGTSLHSYSLLPQAWGRAASIARWLAGHAGHLGTDGRRLLRALATESLVVLDPAPEPAAAPIENTRAGVVERRCGPWTLVAAAGQPVDLRWVPTRPTRVG